MYDKMNNTKIKLLLEEILFGTYKGIFKLACIEYGLFFFFFFPKCLFSLKAILRDIL